MTYMLSAFKATTRDCPTSLKPNPVLVKDEADLYPSLKRSQVAHSTNRVSSDALKFLNLVALLLVREHEIVAVLPKRSGSRAHVNVIVTTDSDSDPDEPCTGDDSIREVNRLPLGVKYLVTRNPRDDSPPGKRSNPGVMASEVLRALAKVTTLKGMYEYLIKYRWVLSSYMYCTLLIKP